MTQEVSAYKGKNNVLYYISKTLEGFQKEAIEKRHSQLTTVASKQVENARDFLTYLKNNDEYKDLHQHKGINDLTHKEAGVHYLILPPGPTIETILEKEFNTKTNTIGEMLKEL